MENAKLRVLAYSLAKEISNDELEEVSGGGGAKSQFSTSPTLRASGSNGSWDTTLDITLDW